ncbi:major tail sheath protein (Protein FI), partial [Escherichia coli H383]
WAILLRQKQKKLIMLPSETMIWQPEFTDKTLSRKLAQTVSNIIGTTDENGQYTGLKALLAAESVTGVKPRILGVPGLDTKEVAVALASVCQKLRAFGYISAWGCKTISEVKAYRQNFSQRELMVIWPDFLAWDTVTSTTATAYATARALGLRAKIDQVRITVKEIGE